MKVINVRGGIACNSSSSHSLLIPHTPIGHEQRYVPNHMDYGWENFTETNPMIYFAVLLCQQLVNELGPAAEYVMRGLFPGMTPQWTEHSALLGQLQSSHYVDHQSTFFFPRTPDGKSVNFEFFRVFLNWAQAKNLVVLGGNDNDEGVHPLFDQGTVLKEEDYHFHMWGGLRARQDALHPDIWSLYNPKTGMKLRLWFGIDEPPATLRGMPELLDVKLTNWCNMGCEFCLDPTTPVLMSDFSWKPIGEIVVGDEVVGFDENSPGDAKFRQMQPSTVEATWTTQQDAVRITFEEGDFVICSSSHRWLCDTGRWRSTHRLKIGDKIHRISTAIPWDEPKIDDEYRQGYLAAVTASDATFKPHPTPEQRQIWWRLAVTDHEFLERTREYLNHFGISVSERVFAKENEDHREVRSIETRAAAQLMVIKELTRTPEKISDSWARGWLAGFFDAEGTCGYHGALRIYQRDLPGNEHSRALCGQLLNQLGFDYVLEERGFRVRGSTFTEIARFFGMTRPAISRKYPPISGGKRGTHSEIVKIEQIGKRELVDITTSTRTFIAQGLASHNCYQSSTIEGAHADFNIWDIASTIIQEVGPWEVALGGGEATGHPRLHPLARILHEHGTNVSITTRNVKWILDNADNDSFAAIAYSADQSGDRVLEHLVDAAGDKIHFQFVEGVSSIFHIRDVLRHFPETPITILGYKDVGFGKDYAPKIVPWEEHQKELLVRLLRQNLGRVRVDTAFLRRHPDLAEQFHKASWHTSEGSWSAYVDLVTKRVAPSSYSPPEAFIGFDPADSGSLRTALQQIEIEG